PVIPTAGIFNAHHLQRPWRPHHPGKLVVDVARAQGRQVVVEAVGYPHKLPVPLGALAGDEPAAAVSDRAGEDGTAVLRTPGSGVPSPDRHHPLAPTTGHPTQRRRIFISPWAGGGAVEGGPVGGGESAVVAAGWPRKPGGVSGSCAAGHGRHWCGAEGVVAALPLWLSPVDQRVPSACTR